MQLERCHLDLRYAHLRVMDPDHRKGLLASIARDGQTTPVLTVLDADTHVVVDGYTRVWALGELGHDLVDATELNLGEVDALLLAHRFHIDRRCNVLEEAWLCNEILERHGWTQVSLAAKLGRAQSWVSRRLAIIEVLPALVQKLAQEGRIKAHAVTRYLVPMARTNARHCEHMAEAFARHQFSDREASRLYDAWKKSEATVREKIIHEPTLFLRSQKVAQEVPNDELAPVLRDLGILSGVCMRLCRRCAEDPIDRSRENAMRRLASALAG